MKQRKTVLDMYWDSLETGVREGYAMLAVPVWFDGRLADRLAEEFDTPLLTIHDKFSRERSFVSKYENRGWIIEQGLREYLLEKAAHIYGDGLEDIHRCLAQYYREFSGQGLSSRKHEATYLYFHHLLQVEPLVAGQAVLGHLDETEDINLQPVLKSLVSIYRMLPGRIEPAPEFKLLELFLAAFAGRGDTKALKHIRSECEEIREAADEENRVLLKQVYRLQISLQHQLGGKKADKIIKKLNKKIEKLSGAVEVPTFDYSKNSHDKTSRKNSFGKYKQVLQSVGKIIALHQRGDDEGAGREREYLAELQKDRKDLLSKSYCNIAAALAGKTGTTDWESEYIELALKTNRFDAVVLNAKGERLAKMGKIEEAIQLFDRSYKVNPNDEVCLNAKGKLLAKMGKFEQAIELFDHAFQVNPNDGVCLNAKAELLAKMGKFKQAIELFDRAHAIAPNNEVPLNAKAELMAKMGKFEEAIQLFDLAHTIAPKNEVCLTAKAELLAKMGKHKQALELFDRAQAIAPNNAVSLNAKAKLLAKMGKFKQAIELFDRALRISPDNAIPLTAKGALLAKMGKPTEAIELFDRALEIAPDNVISITAKGELLVKMGKFEQAIQLFDRAHAIAPNNAVCLTAKAELLAKMGKTEEAIELFDRAHAIAPNSGVCLNAKAELLAKMGKVEEAIELFDRAFQVNPNDEVCLNAKAELLAKMGKFEEAIELFDRSYKVNPNDVVCLTAKGKLLTKMGKIEEAIELFDRAFQIDPTYPVTLSANASLLTKPGRIEEAIKKYRAAVESIGKHDPYFLCGLGFLLLKRNSGNHDINEAIDLFTRAEMYSGSEEISLLGLWVAHARLGNHDKSMHYKNLFHQKKAAPAGEETQIPQEPEEKQFNRVEDEITAENMADNTVYNRLISAILSYALSVMR